MQKESAAWVRKAEADWFGAQKLDAEKLRVNDVICFHYPDMSSTSRQAKAALRSAARVRDEVRRRLGVKT